MVPVKSCMVPIEKIVKVDRDVSIKTAAKMMRDNGIGSIFVTSGEEIIGILTDTDLVRRIVAAGQIRFTRRLKKSCRLLLPVLKGIRLCWMRMI